MNKLSLIVTFALPILSFGQKSAADTNYIFWSRNRPLQKEDFQIKVGNISSSYSFAQYSFDYSIRKHEVPRDYKKKIRNYFIKSASWLDTTYDVATSLKYQQTLFDLAEVYVRQFRKSIYENRKKIAWGKVKIDDLNSQALTAFSNRRVQYDTATNFGTITDKQKEWEILIAKELNSLEEFSSE
jgi:hypothetical protein